MKTLKRKHARLFWGLFGAFFILELLGWGLRFAAAPWLLEAGGWAGIVGFVPLAAAGLVWRRFLQCPNCGKWEGSGSARLNPKKTDCCKNCGKPILFDDQL